MIFNTFIIKEETTPFLFLCLYPSELKLQKSGFLQNELSL